jgi:hypothetical protein
MPVEYRFGAPRVSTYGRLPPPFNQPLERMRTPDIYVGDPQSQTFGSQGHGAGPWDAHAFH